MDSSLPSEYRYSLPPVPSALTPEVVVRRATSKDIPAIQCLIHLLAQFESREEAITATDSALLHTLNLGPESTSSSQNLAYAIMVFEDDVPVGICIYYIIYSSWRATGGIWIEDLFVKEECRGKGYGIRLMAECAKEVRMKYPDGGRLEWSVKIWNEPAIAFYKRHGATMCNDEVRMRLEDATLEKLSELGRVSK